MCGIAGILSLDPRLPADPVAVQRMRDRLTHRGPDDAGLFADGPIALGHRRLSIIDLEGGHQPMLFEDGRLAIAYNGEVYNYRALRRDLEGRGRRFRTDSDTEVVLAAYAEHGLEFVRGLDGMFALAIWDETHRRLVLARDRLGIKPLFLHVGGQRVAFASEIKALLELPDVSREWDLQALHDYFHFLYVPEPGTAYRAIRHVPPASCVVVDPGGIREQRYWELRPGSPLRGEAALAVTSELLSESVASQLVSDVPLGAFLSGGIDSGLIVAFMTQARRKQVDTFNVYDPQFSFYDERDLARRVADAYHTRHHELKAGSEVNELLEEVVSSFDEPFADSGALPNLVVCRETRRAATVALSGLGGDELFAGYVRYSAMKMGSAGRFVPAPLRRWLTALVDHLPEGRGLALDRLKRGARLLGLPEADRYTGMVTAGGRLRRPVMAPSFLAQVDPWAPLRLVRGHIERGRDLGLDEVNRLLYTDLLTYIPGDLLRLADRTSMRFSLEVRVPYLNHRLVEAALGMPGGEKLRHGRRKRLLRRLSRRWLPPEVVRAPKRGFGGPMAAWLRGPLAPAMERAVEITAPETGVLERAALREAWREHRSGRASHEEILWATLVFARWAEAR